MVCGLSSKAAGDRQSLSSLESSFSSWWNACKLPSGLILPMRAGMHLPAHPHTHTHSHTCNFLALRLVLSLYFIEMASSFMKIIYNLIALWMPVQRGLWRELGEKRQGQNRLWRYRCMHGNEPTQTGTMWRLFQQSDNLPETQTSTQGVLQSCMGNTRVRWLPS